MLALGAAIGAVQGFFIAYEGIPAFIVTLAGLRVIRGVALLITGGYSIPVDPGSRLRRTSAAAWLLGVPVPALHRASRSWSIGYLDLQPDPLRPLRHRHRRQCRGGAPRRRRTRGG